MDWKLSSAIPIFVCLLAAAGAAIEITQSAIAQRTIYTTPPKTAVAKLKSTESNVYEVRGKVMFTLTAANTDDTIVGTLVYTVPDEARKRIAQISGKSLNSIPTNVVKKDVAAVFQNGTACPIVSIEIGVTELDVAGARLNFNRIVADVIETSEEVPQLLCAWTRQINTKRQRRGIIASINRLISGEP